MGGDAFFNVLNLLSKHKKTLVLARMTSYIKKEEKTVIYRKSKFKRIV